MIRPIVFASIILFLGCSGGGEPVAAQHEYAPLIMLLLEDTQASRDLPWILCDGKSDASGCILLNDREQGNDGYDRILQEVAEHGLLVACVRDAPGGPDIQPDGIKIWTDSRDSVHTIPAELGEQLPDQLDLDRPESQQELLDIFLMYKPDIVLIDLSIRKPETAVQLGEYWTSRRILSDFRVTVHCIPGAPDCRQWCIIAGRNINGTTPLGLTEGGFYSTLRVLAGLSWLEGLPGSVPAVSIFQDRSELWRSDPEITR